MSVAVPNNKCLILHVDDDEDDRFFFQNAATRTKTPFNIQPLSSGALAIAYLKQEAPYADLAAYPPPVLILCDHNPRSEGHDLVAAIRALALFANLPIIMFSGSEGTDGIARCYRAGADHFLRKPIDSTRLDIIVQTLYACAISTPGSFDALTRLDEYLPRPL